MLKYIKQNTRTNSSSNRMSVQKHTKVLFNKTFVYDLTHKLHL